MSSPYSPLKVAHHAERLKILRNGGQPSPTQVQLVISDLCNHDCPWCAYRLDGYTSNELFKVIEPDGSVNRNPNRMISYEKCLEILDDCVALGVRAVQITGGGEPTAHPRHADIFAAVLDRGLDLALVSNGTILRTESIPLLLRAKWVRFSLDAGNAETYAAIRRVPGSYFSRFIQNVTAVCNARDKEKASVIVGVGFVVTRDNWGEIIQATKIASDCGANNIRISAVFQNDDAAYFDGFHSEAAELCREAAGMYSDRFKVFNNFGDRLADLEQHAPDYSFCGYQHFNTFIGADLSVYRCCVQAYNPRGLLGSLKDQGLKQLWESQEKRDGFNGFDARGCERCMFNEKNRTINYLLESEPAHVNFV